MEREEFLQAFAAITFSSDRLHDSFAEVSAILASKRRILKSPIPYTLRDEIDLHRGVLENIDAGISLISTLQKMAGLPRLDFPIHHNLLRFFRDVNHHVGYKAFAPILFINEGETDFYVWPTLQWIPAVQKKYPNWRQGSLKLDTLLAENHQYIVSLLDSSQERINTAGLEGKFHPIYQIGQFHLGSLDRET